MTPPDTNIKKQRRRHWPVIWGIFLAVVLAFLGWVFLTGATGDVDDATSAGETAEPG